MSELIVGLVSISDRASTGVYKDEGLPALKEWLGRAIATPWRAEERLIPDEQPVIAEHGGAVIEWLVADGDPVSPGQPLLRLHPISEGYGQ